MAYGLYLHIPYCHSRCFYCDFYSNAPADCVPEAYIDALLRDFSRYAPLGAAGSPLRPRTVYFGGGTPGLLAPAQVKRILQTVRPSKNAEVTLEANPDSATPEKLAGWRAAGVNRLSLGVQSAHDESLKRLGRPHTAQQARQALAHAAAAGFENISGDLMMALPHYSTGEFDDTLALLVQGGVSHISAYLLKLEPGTPLGDKPPPGLPGADDASEFYFYAVARLEAAGYRRYEISNFARPGFAGRHNLLYWNCKDYLGLGAAAHSSLGGRRLAFAPQSDSYIADRNPLTVEGKVTADDYIMLQLRLEEGLSPAKLRRHFGLGLSARQQKLFRLLAQNGLAVQRGQAWALTSQGLLVQNSILAELLEFDESS